ncbi:hypothetical protein ES703_67125 [subsurface metagenome]
MKFDHNQICTRNNEIEVGKQYIYRESLPTIIAEVKILSDDSDKEFIRFTVVVIKSRGSFPKVGEQFSISAKRGHYAYGGMWRLEDSGTYLT